MNDNTDPESLWARRLADARRDTPPPVDLPALLRAIRAAEPPPRLGWAEEFVAVFAGGRTLAGCVAGFCALGAFASWQAWETWQAVPWAQWVAVSTGGLP